ncbi:MAG: VanZ family protein [Deltaproteobacteria bacterium]|nr:VanZ family protein [Deltaproteobacteria bacterium]
MKKSRVLIFHWLPLLFYCALIFVLSSRPVPKNIPDIFFLDKRLHFFGYGLLGILFFRAYRTLSLKNRPRLMMFLSMASATLYGISDEIHQHFVPTRTADMWDVLADMLGSIFSVFILHQVLSRRI